MSDREIRAHRKITVWEYADLRTDSVDEAALMLLRDERVDWYTQYETTDAEAFPNDLTIEVRENGETEEFSALRYAIDAGLDVNTCTLCSGGIKADQPVVFHYDRERSELTPRHAECGRKSDATTPSSAPWARAADFLKQAAATVDSVEKHVQTEDPLTPAARSAGGGLWKDTVPADPAAVRFNLAGAVERAIMGRADYTGQPTGRAIAGRKELMATCLDLVWEATKRLGFLDRLSPDALWLVPQDHLSEDEREYARFVKTIEIAVAIAERRAREAG